MLGVFLVIWSFKKSHVDSTGPMNVEDHLNPLARQLGPVLDSRTDVVRSLWRPNTNIF